MRCGEHPPRVDEGPPTPVPYVAAAAAEVELQGNLHINKNVLCLKTCGIDIF